MLPQQSQPLTTGCCQCRSRRSHPTLRTGEISAGALSLGIWMLIPKCPLCLAAQMALWTGLGLSFTQATYLRWSLLAISGAVLSCLAFKQMVRRRRLDASLEFVSPNWINDFRDEA